jgi:hypothetical protein
MFNQKPQKTMLIDLLIIGLGTALIFGFTTLLTLKPVNK